MPANSPNMGAELQISVRPVGRHVTLRKPLELLVECAECQRAIGRQHDVGEIPPARPSPGRIERGVHIDRHERIELQLERHRAFRRIRRHLRRLTDLAHDAGDRDAVDAVPDVAEAQRAPDDVIGTEKPLREHPAHDCTARCVEQLRLVAR